MLERLNLAKSLANTFQCSEKKESGSGTCPLKKLNFEKRSVEIKKEHLSFTQINERYVLSPGSEFSFPTLFMYK